MKILILANRNAGCDYHRLILPFNYMDIPKGSSYRIIHNDEGGVMKSDFNVDIVIYNRIPHADINYILDLQKIHKFKIIVDIDDHWDLGTDHPLYLEYTANKTSERILKSIRTADVVTTTNQQLKEEILKHNTNVRVIPNGIPIDQDQFKPIEHPYQKLKDLLNIGYIGGKTHLKDIVSIQNVFSKLAFNEKWIKNGRFILFGVTYTRDNTWQNIEHVIKVCKKHSKIGMLPLQNYMHCYDITDVSIAPLVKNFFNSFKSTLKVAEAGAKKVPIIASAVMPYLEDISAPGLTLCNNQDEWYETIDNYLNNPSKAKIDGNNLYNYVKNKYNLFEINKLRTNLIQEL